MTSKQEQLAQLEREYMTCGAHLSELSRQISALRAEMSDLRLNELFADGITFERIMSVPYSSIEGSSWHRKLRIWLDKQPGISASGYWPETDQLAVKIRISRKQPLAEQQATIAQIMPWIKPLSPGIVAVSISERSLSQYGSYRLEVSNGKYVLTIRVYGRDTVLKEFSQLDEAISYIHQHHSCD